MINERAFAHNKGPFTWEINGQLVAELPALGGMNVQIADILSVRAPVFGATGNGTTDDTQAFKNVIASIPANDTRIYAIYVPDGVFRLSDEIVIGSRRVVFYGVGTSGAFGSTLYQTNPNKYIFDYATGNLDTVRFEGLCFKHADAAGTGGALKLGSVAQAALDGAIMRCWFVSMPGKTINGVNLQGYEIAHCTFDSSSVSGITGIYIESGSNNRAVSNRYYGQSGGGYVLRKGENNSINGGEFDFCGGATNDTGAAIVVDVPVTAGGDVVRALSITSVNFRVNENDISLDGNGGSSGANTGCNDVLISGCVTDRTTRRFLYATDSDNIRVMGNLINSPSQDGDLLVPAIELAGTCADAFVDGNSLTDQTGVTVRPNFGLKTGASTLRTRIGFNNFTAAQAEYSIGGTLAGGLEIPDGVTAPATVSGLARLYVDTADGDLKVKFGDGTVKTIVVDT